jgi:hypothetical protein
MMSRRLALGGSLLLFSLIISVTTTSTQVQAQTAQIVSERIVRHLKGKIKADGGLITMYKQVLLMKNLRLHGSVSTSTARVDQIKYHSYFGEDNLRFAPKRDS